MQYLLCAKIGAPFGIKGALHLYPLSGQQDSLLGVPAFYRQRNGQYELCAITTLKKHGDHLLVFFEGLTNPEDAAAWTNEEIYVHTKDLPRLKDNQFYWYELIGLTVHGLQGQDYGVVVECYNTHHDVIKTSKGNHIPFIQGDIIHSVNREAKMIIVDFDCLDESDDLEKDTD